MTVTLEFLAAQQDRILAELAGLRDDVRVTAAIVQRLDGTMSGALNEIRAEHARSDRLAERVRRLEEEARQPHE
jgi:sRNA-binding protein